MSSVAGGLAIVQELFPETADLEVVTEEGLEALQVLAVPVTNEGNPVWLLPKLAVLRLSTFDATFNYDRIVIERTRAARSAQSILSPITLLTLRLGLVDSEVLGKLDEVGIKYERDGISLGIPIF